MNNTEKPVAYGIGKYDRQGIAHLPCYHENVMTGDDRCRYTIGTIYLKNNHVKNTMCRWCRGKIGDPPVPCK